MLEGEIELLLVESGATKTQWASISQNRIHPLGTTRGFNPTVQGWDAISAQLENDAPRVRPTTVRFFGAAFSRPSVTERMTQLLQVCYPRAQVTVEHDLLGAALSVGAGAPVIVGILGTGSSAAFYDGTRVVEVRGGHGYLLGDEGSGAYLGLGLLRSALAGELPEDVCRKLELWAGKPLTDQRAEVYADTTPNVRLAGYAPFLAENRAFFSDRIEASFIRFLRLAIEPLQDRYRCEWSVVGSVAAAFDAELLRACQAAGVQPPVHRVAHPMEGLAAYFQAQLQRTAPLPPMTDGPSA